MPGNQRVFVSHTHEDNELCVPLLAALDAWGVDYWFDTEQLDPGSQLSERIQQALSERDIFLRVCTPAAQRSFWMSQELAAAQGMRDDARSRGQVDRRKLIFMALAPGYVHAPNEQANVLIDATSSTRANALKQLRLALGVSLPERRISRRALLGGSAVGAVAVIGSTAAGTLYLTKDVTPAVPPVLPTTRLSAQATPQPSATRLKWYFKTSGGEFGDYAISGLTSAGTSLYVNAQDGLYALGAADGSLLWLQNTVRPTSGGYPTASGDSVYIGGERMSDLAKAMAALNAHDGSVRWTQAVDGDVSSTPVVAGNSVYAMTSKGLYAFQASDGTPRWKQPLPQGDNLEIPSPTVADGVVYVGGGDKAFYAFDAQSGSLLWRTPLGASISSTPAVAKGIVYFGGGSNDGAIYALNATDGSQRWRVPDGDGYVSMDSTPLVQNGVVYIGSYLGTMYALDADTGKIRWQVKPAESTSFVITCRAAISGNALYVTAGEGRPGARLYALSLHDGSTLWSYTGLPTLSSMSLSPAVSGGLVIFSGGNEHALYALSM